MTAARPPMDDEPDWFSFDAWQRTDDAHPQGEGRAAYRTVFKTLRVALLPGEFKWPNMLMRFGGGKVERGGVHTPGTVDARRHDHLILPEWGEIVVNDGVGEYRTTSYTNPTFAAWEELTESCFYVEMIVDVEGDTPSSKLANGRAAVASMITLIDLHFGTRVLGVRLAEEAGERFDDWHFNRQLGVSRVGWEPQLNVAAIEQADLIAWGQTAIDGLMNVPAERRRRIALACSWFQDAGAATDPAIEFLGLWVVLEVLAMPDTTNISPLRERLAEIAGGVPADWSQFVGRLFGRRGDLVHGVGREITEHEVDVARALAQVLLAAEFKLDLDRRVAQVAALRDSGA